MQIPGTLVRAERNMQERESIRMGYALLLGLLIGSLCEEFLFSLTHILRCVT